MASLSDFGNLFTAYHLGHLLAVLAYFPLRTYVLVDLEHAQAMFGAKSGTMTTDWLTQEQELLVIALFTLFMKSRKAATLQQLFDKATMFGKLFVFAVLLRMSQWILMGVYGLFCAAFFVLLGTATFSGDSELIDVTIEEFDRIKTPKTTSDRKAYWFVLFHADWCTKSVSLEPLFAKLSMKYTDEQTKWAKVDVEQYPSLAAEFSISTSEWQNTQLPTLICFHKGKEIQRLPALSSEGKVIDCNFAEHEVVKVFNLDGSNSSNKKNPKKLE